ADVKKLPVNFGKQLAHTDKGVRDRGLKKLKRWLLKHPDLGRLEYMKVWKALYFAMWMADKRPVQQELAVQIALLINDVPHDKRTLWMDTFWETMRAPGPAGYCAGAVKQPQGFMGEIGYPPCRCPSYALQHGAVVKRAAPFSSFYFCRSIMLAP
ncbi:unnamed protein product, partial [Effrenium voratum]